MKNPLFKWREKYGIQRISCSYCGQIIVKLTPRQRFCDRNCAKKYYNRSRKPQLLTARRCKWCRNIFTPEKRRDQVFCSTRCLQAADRSRHGIPATGRDMMICQQCGDPFIREQRREVYCGDKCRHAHKLQKKKIYSQQMRHPQLSREVLKPKAVVPRVAFAQLDKDAWEKQAYAAIHRITTQYG